MIANQEQMPVPHRATRDGAQMFDLPRFLEGQTHAWGVFQDRFGRVRNRFTVEMEGRWEGTRFQLNEAFAYDDGRSETRVWSVTAAVDGQFEASCADCIGRAKGRLEAGFSRMSYTFRLKLPSRTLDVTFDDRIFPMSADTAVNRAIMRKWGIKLGELWVFFQRGPLPRGGRGGFRSWQ